MEYEIEIENRLRKVIVMRTSDGLVVEIDGHAWYVDAARIDAHRMSLLVAGAAPERHTGPVGPPEPRPRGRPRGDGPIGPGALTVSREVAFSSVAASAELVVHVGTTPFTVVVNARRRRHDVIARGGAHGSGQRGAPGEQRPQRILAPMPGKVVRVLVQVGDQVRARQPLVVVEAMKMENELRAGRDGHVAAVQVQEGASVDAGALMVVIE
jgi:biotin carboxyl carrier protein